MDKGPIRSAAAKGRGAAILRVLLWNAGAFLLVAAAGEAVLRVLPPSPGPPADPVPVPGRTFRYASPPRGPGGIPEFDVEITMNRYGFHGPDHPPRRKKGARRIALIGDSMVEAIQVERTEGLAARLEERLPGTEVLGFGMGGHPILRQGRILRMLPGLLVDGGGPDLPDLAVFVVHGPYSVREALVDHVRGPAPWRRGMYDALRRFTGPSLFLLRARNAVLTSLLVPSEELSLEAVGAFQPGRKSELLDRAWELMDGGLAALAADSRALGIRPVFAYIPDASEMDPPRADHDPLAFAGRFESMAVATGADWIDISVPFRAEAGPGGTGCFFKVDRHLTPKGHALAARLLAGRLAEVLAKVPLKD